MRCVGMAPRASRGTITLAQHPTPPSVLPARHSLLVTGMGSVYSAGDGTDGALGLGVRESSDAFRLVEW